MSHPDEPRHDATQWGPVSSRRSKATLNLSTNSPPVAVPSTSCWFWGNSDALWTKTSSAYKSLFAIVPGCKTNEETWPLQNIAPIKLSTFTFNNPVIGSWVLRWHHQVLYQLLSCKTFHQPLTINCVHTTIVPTNMYWSEAQFTLKTCQYTNNTYIYWKKKYFLNPNNVSIASKSV